MCRRGRINKIFTLLFVAMHSERDVSEDYKKVSNKTDNININHGPSTCHPKIIKNINMGTIQFIIYNNLDFFTIHSLVILKTVIV